MKAEVRAVPVGDLLPNPYRNMEKYHISEDKVAALVQSYGSTGFWDGSIQGRPSPNDNGRIEIAFGHHRVEAAKQFGLKEIGVVVGEKDNSTMLRMMADENHLEFKHDSTMAVETIAAVVEAYGRGEIELEAVPLGGAGSGSGKGEHQGVYFIFPDKKMKPYTLITIARFLKWTKANGEQALSACRDAFNAYQELEAVEMVQKEIPPDA